MFLIQQCWINLLAQKQQTHRRRESGRDREICIIRTNELNAKQHLVSKQNILSTLNSQDYKMIWITRIESGWNGLWLGSFQFSMRANISYNFNLNPIGSLFFSQYLLNQVVIGLIFFLSLSIAFCVFLNPLNDRLTIL